MNELRNRGVQDVLIAVVDGLEGFPEAITAAFRETAVQTPVGAGGRLCVVRLVRHSLNFCSWKDRKAVAAGLRGAYEAGAAEAARDALEAFDEAWGRQCPSIARAWQTAWEEVIPLFAFGRVIRRVIHTTNAARALNRVIREAIKTRGSFPSEGGAEKGSARRAETPPNAEKLIHLAIREHEKTTRGVRE